jgi:hypothetical protein
MFLVASPLFSMVALYSLFIRVYFQYIIDLTIFLVTRLYF